MLNRGLRGVLLAVTAALVLGLSCSRFTLTASGALRSARPAISVRQRRGGSPLPLSFAAIGYFVRGQRSHGGYPALQSTPTANGTAAPASHTSASRQGSLRCTVPAYRGRGRSGHTGPYRKPGAHHGLDPLVGGHRLCVGAAGQRVGAD